MLNSSALLFIHKQTKLWLCYLIQPSLSCCVYWGLCYKCVQFVRWWQRHGLWSMQGLFVVSFLISLMISSNINFNKFLRICWCMLILAWGMGDLTIFCRALSEPCLCCTNRRNMPQCYRTQSLNLNVSCLSTTLSPKPLAVIHGAKVMVHTNPPSQERPAYLCRSPSCYAPRGPKSWRAPFTRFPPALTWTRGKNHQTDSEVQGTVWGWNNKHIWVIILNWWVYNHMRQSRAANPHRQENI